MSYFLSKQYGALTFPSLSTKTDSGNGGGVRTQVGSESPALAKKKESSCRINGSLERDLDDALGNALGFMPGVVPLEGSCP